MSRELKVTLRGGRLLAAYLYFRKDSNTQVAGTKREAHGMLVDYSADGIPLGIEFVAPSKLTLAKVNALLQSLGEEPASVEELWPLIGRDSGATAA